MKARIAWWWGILVCLLLAVTSGCATRQQRFMPDATIPASTAQVLIADCSDAITAAHADKAAVPRMVDSCSAVSAVNCGSWIDTNIMAEHGIVMSDSTAVALGGATTIAAGAFDFSPAGVATVGAVQMLLHLFGQVEKTALGAPDTFTAQNLLIKAQGDCSSALVQQANAGSMSFSDAIGGIDRCRRLCSPGAAAAISTQALQQSTVVVQPSGAFMLRARTVP